MVISKAHTGPKKKSCLSQDKCCTTFTTLCTLKVDKDIQLILNGKRQLFDRHRGEREILTQHYLLLLFNCCYLSPFNLGEICVYQHVN